MAENAILRLSRKTWFCGFGRKCVFGENTHYSGLSGKHKLQLWWEKHDFGKKKTRFCDFSRKHDFPVRWKIRFYCIGGKSDLRFWHKIQIYNFTFFAWNKMFMVLVEKCKYSDVVRLNIIALTSKCCIWMQITNQSFSHILI